MLEERKQKEKNHYNKQAEEIIKKNYTNFDWCYGAKKYELILGIPFRFTEEKTKEIIGKKIKKGKITHLLDYDCGNGIHSIFPVKWGAKVYGIDISQKSIEIAKEWARRENVEKQTTFLVMDCEKLEFPNDFFYIIFLTVVRFPVQIGR